MRTAPSTQARNIWAYTLRTMCFGVVTAERILDAWAKAHGRTP